MFKKKASANKKIESLINEANDLRNQEEFDNAIAKFKEAIKVIQEEFKESEFIEKQVEKIENEIITILSDKINRIILKAKEVLQKNQLKEANLILSDALEVAKRIESTEIKNNFIRNIENLINLNNFKISLEQATSLLDKNEPQKALKLLTKLEEKLDQIPDSSAKEEMLEQVKNLMKQTYHSQVEGSLIKVNALIGQKDYDKALKILKEHISTLHSIEKTDEISLLVRRKMNEIYSMQIEPIILEGNRLINEGNLEEANSIVEDAKKIVNIMEETEQKSNQLKKISEMVNPQMEQKIELLLAESMAIINQEEYKKSTKLVGDATKYFVEALDLAEMMIESEEREEKISKIKKLLDQTCSNGISFRKDKAKQNVEDKNFEGAIGEIYSALSIAKSMSCAEEDNEEIMELKNFINNIYSAQIEDVTEKAKKKMIDNVFDEARSLLNNALSITNKMYLSNQMEEEINKINNLKKKVEIKETISKGDSLLEKEKFNKEIEELKKKLEKAEIIEDPDEKYKQLQDIKNSIDKVNSSNISLIIEQITLDIKKNKFDELTPKIDQSISIAQKFELEQNKRAEFSTIFNFTLEVIKILINNENYHDVPEFYDKNMGIIQQMEDEKLIDRSISQLIDSSLYLGQILFKQQKVKDASKILNSAMLYCKQIQNEQIMEEFHLKLINQLKSNLMNHVKKLTEEEKYKAVIEPCTSLIDIDEFFIEAYYYLANAYMHENHYGKAIKNFEKIIELNPIHLNTLNSLGLIRELQDQIPEAVDKYKKAINIDLMQFLRINRSLYSELRIKREFKKNKKE